MEEAFQNDRNGLGTAMWEEPTTASPLSTQSGGRGAQLSLPQRDSDPGKPLPRLIL